jgi:8-oxo-dGTP diphosphatase
VGNVIGPPIRAAGGVVWRRVEGVDGESGVEVAVIHRPRYDDWSFPKGKADPGESDEQCALREVEEETGLRCRLGRELATTSYLDRKGRKKTVRYWAMEPLEGEFLSNNEVDRAEWVNLRSALERLSYDHDVANVEELVQQEVNAASILLVRHATAGKRDKWDGDDRRRPLDGRGRRQAAELAEILSDYPVKRILSSPYARCIQSVEPLGERLGLEIEAVDELAEGATAGDVHRLMESLSGELAVLCTHGDVVEAVLGSSVPNKKGGVWVMRDEDGSFEPIRYLVPPSAD